MLNDVLRTTGTSIQALIRLAKIHQKTGGKAAGYFTTYLLQKALCLSRLRQGLCHRQKLLAPSIPHD
jgi:hypothetical protein